MKFTFAPESKPLDGYTIKRAIYRGGFGEVYYALTDAGREVALKLLQNNTEIELRGVQQCLNLSHPNLVTIFDIKQDADGDHWIVMEYVGGETLDKAIRRSPSGMPMEEVRRWLPGIASGVSYLHEHGLVHRDLKPANIFSDNGGVRVGDVGLSKFITPSRRSAQTQSVGTVYYMAPEVARGRYGKEVDVYALGIILYEMLTGQVPFEGDSTGEILMKHLTEKPDLRKLPPRLRPVIGRALEKDPASRFGSIDDLSRAFDDAVLGRARAEAREAGQERVFPEDRGTRREHRVSAGGPRAPWKRFGSRWEQDASRRWRYAGAPSHPGELFGTTVKWLLLSLLFSWIGWGFLVPVAAVLSAVFGIMFVVNAISWSATGLARGVHGAFRDARFAASSAGWAARRAAGAAIGMPRAAGNAVHAAAGYCGRRLMGEYPGRVSTPALTRWTQWTGTATITTLLVGAFTSVLAVVWPQFAGSPETPMELSNLATFGLSAILASWGITAATKFWDGSTGGLIPRVSLGLVGLAVGAGIWKIERFLHADILTQPLMFAFPRSPAEAIHFHGLELSRELVSTMLFCGLLFFARNWMRQTSVSRRARLRLSSLAFTTLVAAVIAGILEAPNGELLMTWAAVVSATVQVASAWSDPRDKLNVVTAA